MGASIIKHDRVRFGEASPARAQAAKPGAPSAARPAKKVELVRHEGEVRAIEVTCACGEVTLVEVEYEAQGAAPAPATPSGSAHAVPAREVRS